MKNYKWYKIALIKAYFEKGYSITSYPKWVFATLGVGSVVKGYSLNWILIGGLVYGLMCVAVGKILYKKGFVLAETEVTNQYNPLASEIRVFIDKKNGKKINERRYKNNERNKNNY